MASLIALINYFEGTQVLTPPEPLLAEDDGMAPDLIDIKGQETAKRALKLCAAAAITCSCYVRHDLLKARAFANRIEFHRAQILAGLWMPPLVQWFRIIPLCIKTVWLAHYMLLFLMKFKENRSMGRWGG